ncbi:MAG: ABC transporter ATP-binding protein [Planctomycetes bacterium]|nr:ABC transporter ATP-binding protein [Planctomycetota bacterium]
MADAARLRWFPSIVRAFGRPTRLLARRWPLVLGGTLLVPVHAAVLLWMPSLLGQALDGLQHAGADRAAATLALHTTCWWLVGLALAEAASRYLSRKALIDVSRQVEQDLKDAAIAHLQRLPVSWFDRARTGDLVSRLTQDVELVRFVMGPLLLHGGSTLCLLPAGAVLMLRMDVAVTLACCSGFLLMFLLMRTLLPRLHRWSKASQEAIGAISQRVQEDFAGIRVVQQFAAADRERAALARQNRRYLLANLRLSRLRSGMSSLTHTTSGLVLLAVLAVGGHQVIHGAITVGQLFEFTGYLGLLTFPLEILGWTIATLPRAHAAGLRIEELFETETEPTEGAAPRLRCALRVQDLTFTYPGALQPALQNVSFQLEPGQKLGLCGPVGSGKSTLLAVLLRFYDPPRGTVFVDGHDLLDLAPAAVRALFAVAHQEPFLFSATIAANLEFAAQAADAARLQAATAAAALDQDLPQLPQGLDTVVGERGVVLSGGQKQRVALARALCADRPGLMLDDTLSAVDPRTERRILAGLSSQRGSRTVLVTSHRLSVLADADWILVLDAGRVVEAGRHQDLLQRGGRYAAAVRRQSEAQALEQAGEASP